MSTPKNTKPTQKPLTLARRDLLLTAGAALTTALVTPAIAYADAPYKRTLRMQSLNSGSKLTITYWADGDYLPSALKRINWFMRDLRTQTATAMHPDLLDLLWELDQHSRSKNPLYTMSGYRTPQTNAKLAAQSEGVDEASFHMRGMAMDLTQNFHDPEELYRIARKLNRGGCGYYPTKRPFVHVDVGPTDQWVWPNKPKPHRAEEYDALQAKLSAQNKG